MARNFIRSVGGVLRKAAGAIKAAVVGARKTAASPTPKANAASPSSAAGAKKVRVRVKTSGPTSKVRIALSKQPALTNRRGGPHNKKSTKNLSTKQRAAVEAKRKKDRDDKKTRRSSASKAAAAQRKNTTGAEPKAKQSVSSRVMGKLAGAVRAVTGRRRK